MTSSPASAAMNSPSCSATSPATTTSSVLVARIYDALRTPFDCNGHRLSSDASIGVAVAPRHGSDLFGLLKSADLAMYAAKAAGRRTYRFFEPSDGKAGQPSPRARERFADGAGRGRI